MKVINLEDNKDVFQVFTRYQAVARVILVTSCVGDSADRRGDTDFMGFLISAILRGLLRTELYAAVTGAGCNYLIRTGEILRHFRQFQLLFKSFSSQVC